MNVVIPNCEVYIGESNNIVVDLPDGIKPTSEYPVIITVTDQHGQPQQGVTVITLGDADYIEKRRNRYVRKNYIANSKGRIYGQYG